MTAVGAYIRELREVRGLSRADLAARVKTHESQIYRIEKGEQDSRGSLLFAIIEALQGNVQDVYQLMRSGGAVDVDEARKLADSVREQIRAAPTVEDRRDAINRLVSELEADPRKLDQLIGYGQRLRDEDRRNGGR